MALGRHDHDWPYARNTQELPVPVRGSAHRGDRAPAGRRDPRPAPGARADSVNGAQALIRALAGSGVDVCFSNPGTSEMHFVAGLDAVPRLRGVLCLFEGVATGAADGYGRMTGRPAATLLHLGPGLANGLANLHNARRAATPVVNVVGEHATYHKRFDAPLESDIDALARAVSHWIRRPARTADVAADAAEAVAAALGPPGGVATLILAADVSWSGGAEPAPPVPPRGPSVVPEPVIGEAAGALRGGWGQRHPAGGRRAAPPRAGGSQPDRGRHRGAAAGRDLSRPAGTRRGPAGPGTPGVPGGVRAGATGRDPAADPGRRPGAGVLLRLPGAAQLAGAWRLPGAHAGPAGRGRVRGAGIAGASGSPRRPGRNRSRRIGPPCPAAA